MRNALLISLVVVAMTSCATPAKVPKTKVRRGAAVKPGRVVLFQPQCRGATDVCTKAFRSGLVGRLSSELELAGFTVSYADELLASTRERIDASGSAGAQGPLATFLAGASGSVQRSVGYGDLPPEGQRALLKEAKAAGVLSLNVLVNEDRYPDAFYDQHVFELNARYLVGEKQELGWVVRCAEAGENMDDLAYGIDVSYAAAADKLARCVAAEAL